MDPVKPETQPPHSKFVEIAKDQPEYRTLPAFVSEEGIVTTEWKFTREERMQIAAGGGLRIAIHTFGKPLQPILPEVIAPILVPEFILRLHGSNPPIYFKRMPGELTQDIREAFRFKRDDVARAVATSLSGSVSVYDVEAFIAMGPQVQ